MTSLAWFALAALAEIAGCYTFWMWLRSGRSVLWIAPGICSLIAFAYLLTRVDVAFAGRAFAAYGGIYIAASLLWMWSIEGRRADAWDLLGAGLCVTGALVILGAHRT
jgi:small multidrug resistance family-3 protein